MLNTENKKLTKEDYNRIPVHYCKHCGSLKIIAVPQVGGDYCDDCGSTSTGKTSIDMWLILQKTLYKPMYKDRPIKKFNPFKGY